MSRPLVRVGLLLLGSGGLALRAQEPAAASLPRDLAIPVHLQIGVPTGAFAQNVAMAGGVGGGVLWTFDEMLGFRADLGVQIYGAETRRVPLGSGALSLVDVDVTTANVIVSGAIGVQLGMPSGQFTPYAGVQLGFGSFTTSTSVNGSNSDAAPFATTTNLSDATIARTAYGGVYVPLRGRRSVLDLGVRRTWHGRAVRYLTPGDITELPSGEVVLSPRESLVDLYTITIGVTLRGGARPEKR
ncbi:MAG: hypothetical protein ACKOCV_02735 [Gemmatimonadota bacterium]